MRVIILVLLCFFTQIFTVSAEELLTERMREIQKGFYVLLPDEFKKSPKFHGFFHEGVSATVRFDIYNESFDTVDFENTYPPYLVEKGKTILSEEILIRPGGKAKLYYMSYMRLGMNTREWMLISGTAKRTYVVKGSFLKSYRAEFKQMLRMCVLSLNKGPLDEEHVVYLMIMNSKSILGEMLERIKTENNEDLNKLRDESLTDLGIYSRWKRAKRHEMSYIYTIDGIFPVETNYQSVFIVAPSTRSYAKNDKQGSARKAVRKMGIIRGVEILEMEDVRIDEMDGYQFIILGYHVETLETTKALVTILFEEDMYYIMVGYVSERYFDEDLETFKGLSEGFQRLVIEKTGETEALLQGDADKMMKDLEDEVITEDLMSEEDREDMENKKILDSIDDFKLDTQEEKAIIKWLGR